MAKKDAKAVRKLIADARQNQQNQQIESKVLGFIKRIAGNPNRPASGD